MQINISVKAKNDLRNIALFIAADSPNRAMSFYEELHIACNELSEHSERYPVVRQYKTGEIRRRNYGRYSIYYRHGSKNIAVLRVVHSAMDQKAITGLG